MVRLPVKVKLSKKGSIDTELDTVRNRLKKSKEEFSKQVAIELQKRLLNPSTAEPYIAATLGVLTLMQAEYWGGELKGEDDPTKLTAARYGGAIRAEILKNFAKGAKTLNPVTGTVDLVLLSNDFLGIGMEGDTKGERPIQWLAYFLSGNIEDNLYWIDKEHYEIFKGDSAPSLGRFGVGELWTISSPEELNKLSGLLKKAGKSYNIQALKHPQSGKAGRPWFESVWQSVDFNQHIQMPAINAALERMKHILFK